MDNGMESMLDTYLFETNTLLEQLDELLIEAEKNADFTSDDVNEIFRIMHTVKGSSAMMEFSSLTTIAHHVEDLFFFIRENGLESLSSEQKSDLFNLMFHSTDALREEITKVENNEPLSDNIDSLIEEINSFLNKISSSGGAAPAAADTGAQSGGKSDQNHPDDDAEFFLNIHFDEGCGMENLRAFMLASSLKDSDLSFRFFPEDVETNSESANEVIENGFFLAFDDEDTLNSAIGIIKNANNIRSYEIIENTRKEEREVPSSIKTDAAPKSSVASAGKNIAPAENAQARNAGGGAAHAVSNKQNLISVSLSKLDSLVAIVGEIVITESMVISSPELQDLKLDSFHKSTRQLRKLTDDLQDIAMSLRMVPISGVFQKMNRIVRDMRKELGKDVRLTIIGEQTEVDKSIVDTISDPIMHIVRNCMDHGIEKTKEERIAAGKNPQGEIILSADHTGGEVIITVSDDGYGIDPAAVLAKARDKGMLTKPESEYSQKEALGLLMLPGFSTNEEVTEYSGRGVGMDVVKRNVESLGGTVAITSTFGSGTCTTLKIPLTMAIVDGMEIAVGKSIFTIPIANIRQSFKVDAKDIIYDAKGSEMVKCMDEFYNIVRIHQLYNIDTEITNLEDGILIWVESNEKCYCLFVDRLIGEQQVVVKPLPVFLNAFNIKDSGISGCTILGDGNISIILDIVNLYSLARQY